MRLAVLFFVCSLPLVFGQRQFPDKPSERMQFFYEQRAFPNGIPDGARRIAVDQIRRRRATALKANALRDAEATPWKLIGPAPTNIPSQPLYQTSGRVTALAIDPRDNNVAYLGAAEGGVWKTRDGGITWIPLTDDQASISTGAIAIDPKDPEIVYVGTGEQNFAFDNYYGAGILKSTNGGQTWTNIVGPFSPPASPTGRKANHGIGVLVIHPTDTNIILAGSSAGGIFRSEDSGQTWENVLGVLNSPGTAIVFHPTNPSTIYAALGAARTVARNGIYRSDDVGKTWRQIGVASLPTADVGRIELTVTPAAPQNLYAAIANGSNSSLGSNLGVFKSTDQGLSFQRLNGVPEYCSSQCWYGMVLRVHPVDPQIMFLGGLNVLRSLDGGATWRSLSAGGTNRVNVHVDQHVFTFTKDAKRLYVGNDGGVWSTEDADQQTVNWTNLNQSLSITQFYNGMSLHPTDPNITLAGAQDNGTQFFTGGAGWDNITCGDGGFTGIDQAVPSIHFAACQNIQLLRNGGFGPYTGWVPIENGIPADDRVQFIPPLVADPVYAQRVFFGTYRLWRSNDSGGLWQAISPDLTFARAGAGTVATIALSQSDSNVIYTGASDGRVMTTTNANDGVNAKWTDRSAGLPGRTVTHITVDPFDARTAYVSFSGFAIPGEVRPGHIYKTVDGGSSWSDLSGDLPNLPANDVVVDPDLPNTLYIATDAGVMMSRDAGSTWFEAGNGLPKVVVLSLSLHRSARILRAASHGRSVWDLSVPATVSRPTIASLTPSTVDSGAGGVQITIQGSNFGSGSQVLWNGSSRTITSATNTQLVVSIPAEDIAGVGRASVVVLNAKFGGGASNPANFTIGPAPRAADGGIISAAFPVSAPIAPGSVVSLFGVNLAPVLREAAGGILPYTLEGASVLVAGVPVPLYFVSSGQINFQMPWTANANANYAVSVVQQNQAGGAVTVRTATFAPGLFATNRQGSGQGAIRIAGQATIAAPVGAFPGSRPAKRGEIIEVYATGFGNVTNRPATGSPASTTVLSRTLTDPTAKVDGKDATVSFSGLAPGSVGLYQINVKVPDNSPIGDAIPIQISIGAVLSNTVTVAVSAQ